MEASEGGKYQGLDEHCPYTGALSIFLDNEFLQIGLADAGSQERDFRKDVGKEGTFV